ncbi:hypothetical protein J6590_014626 [Homalodisca vitripennis]|nr:hypothetical protein J6590_014626 [Homalodisca vitripennis]
MSQGICVTGPTGRLIARSEVDVSWTASTASAAPAQISWLICILRVPIRLRHYQESILKTILEVNVCIAPSIVKRVREKGGKHWNLWVKRTKKNAEVLFDFVQEALSDLNAQLELVCNNFAVEFVECNACVGKRDLTRDGVHFNRKGAARLGSLYMIPGYTLLLYARQGNIGDRSIEVTGGGVVLYIKENIIYEQFHLDWFMCGLQAATREYTSMSALFHSLFVGPAMELNTNYTATLLEHLIVDRSAGVERTGVKGVSSIVDNKGI